MDSGRALLSPLHSPADCGCGILAVLLIYQVYAKFIPCKILPNSIAMEFLWVGLACLELRYEA
jgi:hypothetical protein